MRVSKEKAAENRTALLSAGSRLFRKHGHDGVGVAEIAKAAGLTHGALYAHFPSKEALAAEAFGHGFAGRMAAALAGTGGRRAAFEEHLAALFSPEMRDRVETGCPLSASASEVGRHGPALSASFTQAFEAMVTMLEQALFDVPPPRRRRLAVATVAAQIGAIAVARAVAKTDMALSNEVLEAVRRTIDAVGTRARTGGP